MNDNEDTQESRDSWLQHQHTKKRLHAQRQEVELLKTKLHSVAMNSNDPDVRAIASLLHAAQRLELVFQGKD